MGELYRMVLFIGFFAVVMGVLVFFFGYSTTQYIPKELTLMMHMERFTNNCFAYVDAESGRKHPTIVDARTFTEEVLETCFIPVERTTSFSYQLQLITGDGGEGELDTTIHTSNFDKGGTRFKKSVLVYHEDRLQLGTLFVNYGII